MKLYELLENMEYKILRGGNEPEITGLTINSKEVRAGDLFICIKGLRFDSHTIIKQVQESGSAAVLVDRTVNTEDIGIPVIQVKNTRTAMAYISSIFYCCPDKAFDLIGVTGTNGKTSITYFIQHIMNEDKKRAGVIGTVGVKFQNKDLDMHFATSTTPDTIELFNILSEMKKNKADSVIMEVSSHALALNKVDSLSFKTGIFTNLTQDHLDFHETMENYFDAKKKLFDLCETGVINADDPWGEKLISSANCKVISYGLHSQADVRAEDVKFTGSGISYTLCYKDKRYPVSLPVPGRFTVYNTLAAIGGAISVGISAGKAAEYINSTENVPGRIQSISNKRNISVIVDYAHSPDSLSNIITSVREFTTGKVITVFGCGGDRDTAKRPIMGEIAGRLSDYCVLTSDNPRSELPIDIINDIKKGIIKTGCKYELIEDRKEGIFSAIAMANKGDSVIIAGKGHENYQEFKDRTIYFDDVSVVKEALGEDI